jgi:all-trans-8'-apo-beta-carotenal 15,15'-oxygenase
VAKNTANTCVVEWGDKILALYEGGMPFVLDPETLETRGTFDAGGRLGPWDQFLAHTRTDGKNLVGLKLQQGQQTRLTFMEFDAEMNLIRERGYTAPGLIFVHDFVITEDYYIVVENPIALSVMGAMGVVAGSGVVTDAMCPDTRNTRIVLVPRNPEQPMIEIDSKTNFFTFHLGNAYPSRTNPDEIVVDTCALPTFAFGNELGFRKDQTEWDCVNEGQAYNELWRLRINVKQKTMLVDKPLLRNLDFPKVNPLLDGTAPTRYIYAVGPPENPTITPAKPNADLWPAGSVIKVDTVKDTFQQWIPGGAMFVGEAVYAPRPGAFVEDDGWVIAVVSDAKAKMTSLCVLEAQNMAAGPIARVPLKCFLPLGFHGSFSSASARVATSKL